MCHWTAGSSGWKDYRQGEDSKVFNLKSVVDEHLYIYIYVTGSCLVAGIQDIKLVYATCFKDFQAG